MNEEETVHSNYVGTCPECEGDVIKSEGELLCERCGLVVGEPLRIAEKPTYGKENDEGKKQTSGGPLGTKTQKKTTTKVGDWINSPITDDQINFLKNLIALTNGTDIQEKRAKKIFVKAKNNDLVQRFNVEPTIVACVVAVLIENGSNLKGRLINKIQSEELADIDKNKIDKIISELKKIDKMLKKNIEKPKETAKRWKTELKIYIDLLGINDSKFCEKALKTLEKLEKIDDLNVSAKTPSSLAMGIIYYLVQRDNYKMNNPWDKTVCDLEKPEEEKYLKEGQINPKLRYKINQKTHYQLDQKARVSHKKRKWWISVEGDKIYRMKKVGDNIKIFKQMTSREYIAKIKGVEPDTVSNWKSKVKSSLSD